MGKKRKNQKINVLSNIQVTIPKGGDNTWLIAFMASLVGSIIGVIYVLIQLLAQSRLS